MTHRLLDAVCDSLRDKIADTQRCLTWYESAVASTARHLGELRELLAQAECAQPPSASDGGTPAEVVH